MEAQSQASGQGLVLVTGASGFLGSAIAKALREEGRRVRVLVRPSSPRVNVDAGYEVAVGDLLDRASVARALAGVRQVIHTAADYRLWAPPGEDIVRNNVESTRIIMEEAQRAGYARLRLETVTFMTAAIQLYRAFGFTYCTPFHEVPASLRAITIFMEREV